MDKKITVLFMLGFCISAAAHTNDVESSHNFFDTIDYDSAMTPTEVSRYRQECQNEGFMVRTTANDTLIEIPFTLQGEAKETLVIVHGSGFSSEEWENLKNYYRILSFDLPNMGRSCNVDMDSCHDFIDDIHFVVSELGIGRYTLIGQSIGTVIALVYAHTFPQELSKLILVEESPQLLADDFTQCEETISMNIVESLSELDPSDFMAY